MEYEWDEAKRLANLRKHGIDFTDVPAVFDGDIVTVVRFVARASDCRCPYRT